MPFTPELCQAARVLTKVDQAVLAEQAGVPVDVVASFESGIAVPETKILASLQAALEALGAVFLPEGEAGAGVRLKFDTAESKRIEGWESEGGSAAEDDVP